MKKEIKTETDYYSNGNKKFIVGCSTEPEDVYGCTISDACNSNDNTTIFDASCVYSI